MLREKLLKEVQSHIPIVDRPFKAVADRLGVDEKTVLETLKKLKEERVIRQISPIYDTKSVGYDSSLVAFKVNPESIEDVASFVSKHPGVSHNYERENEFNLWFTIAVPPDGQLSLDETVALMADITGVKEYVILRTVKTFKIGVKLDYGNLDEREEVKVSTKNVQRTLSEDEKKIIYVTQKDIPLVSRPFEVLAEKVNLSEEKLIEKMNSLREEGIMRRFSAILYHRKAGFKANGMAVWKVPEDRIDEVGTHLASFKSVSHCYQRTTNDLWEFNLFSMIHGRTREEVISFIERVGEEMGIRNYKVLFSTREFKKRRVELFSEEFYEWERKYMGVYTHEGKDSTGSPQAFLSERL